MLACGAARRLIEPQLLLILASAVVVGAGVGIASGAIFLLLVLALVCIYQCVLAFLFCTQGCVSKCYVPDTYRCCRSVTFFCVFCPTKRSLYL